MARTKPRARRELIPEPVPLSPEPKHSSAVVRDGNSAVVYHIPKIPPSSYTTTSPPSSNTRSHTSTLPSSVHTAAAAAAAATYQTTIVLPTHSWWTSGLHWHETHTEYLRLIRGSIFVRLGNETRIISAQGGSPWHWNEGPPPPPETLIIRVDRGVRHNWGRAQQHYYPNGNTRRAIGVPRNYYPEDMYEDVVVEEWTDPVDLGKPLFFWNLNGVINPSGGTDPAIGSVVQKLLRRGLGGFWIDLQLFIIFWELDNFPVLLETPIQGYEDRLGVVKKVAWTLENLTTYTVLWVASLIGKVAGLQAVSEERTPNELWESWRREKAFKVKDA